MKPSTTTVVLRWFFRIQITLLCLTLGCAGVGLAAARTEATAYGVPAAVQSDSPVRQRVQRISDKLDRDTLREYAGLLPAPVGNVISIYVSIRNIDKTDLKAAFGMMHKFMQNLSSQ